LGLRTTDCGEHGESEQRSGAKLGHWARRITLQLTWSPRVQSQSVNHFGAHAGIRVLRLRCASRARGGESKGRALETRESQAYS
jgi:hypothetical protein